MWWLEGESSLGGERKFWVTAVLWTGWLLFLSVFQTGDGSFDTSFIIIYMSKFHSSESLWKLFPWTIVQLSSKQFEVGNS